tara:strand:+ start:34 stop:240 length:207 start_codon:yes stop_codon:yes gene_type:complete
MTYTEQEYRQKELNKKIIKLVNGFFNDYYYDDNGRVIVFVKHFKCKTIKRCCCVSGLNCPLKIKENYT